MKLTPMVLLVVFGPHVLQAGGIGEEGSPSIHAPATPGPSAAQRFYRWLERTNPNPENSQARGQLFGFVGGYSGAVAMGLTGTLNRVTHGGMGTVVTLAAGSALDLGDRFLLSTWQEAARRGELRPLSPLQAVTLGLAHMGLGAAAGLALGSLYGPAIAYGGFIGGMVAGAQAASRLLAARRKLVEKQSSLPPATLAPFPTPTASTILGQHLASQP